MTTEYESADLLLKLYDLRRETVMRKARAWFREPFRPQSVQEVLAVYRGKNSAPYRMVTTYWNMAAALVLHGAIEEQMFAEARLARGRGPSAAAAKPERPKRRGKAA